MLIGTHRALQRGTHGPAPGFHSTSSLNMLSTPAARVEVTVPLPLLRRPCSLEPPWDSNVACTSRECTLDTCSQPEVCSPGLSGLELAGCSL